MTDDLLSQIAQSKKIAVSTTADLSGKSYLAAKLFAHLDRPLVVVLGTQQEAVQVAEEMKFFLPENKQSILYFPGYNILPFKSLSYHADTAALRLAVLSELLDPGKKNYIIVTYVDNLVQKVIPKDQFNDSSELVILNEEVDRASLISGVEAAGYLRTSLVEDPGDYSVRGGILDIFPPGSNYPVRMEFFGDLVESMRLFSPQTQRGVKEISETIIIPANEAVITNDAIPHIMARLRVSGKDAGLNQSEIQEYVQKLRTFGRFPGIEGMLSIVYEYLDTFFDYLPENVVFLLDEPAGLHTSANDFSKKALQNYENARADHRLCVQPHTLYLDWQEVQSNLNDGTCVELKEISLHQPAEKKVQYEFNCSSNQDLCSDLRRAGHGENLLKPLAEWFFDKHENLMRAVTIVSQSVQAKRLISLLRPYGIEPELCENFAHIMQKGPGIYYTYGNLSSGFTMADDRIALVTENEIFQVKKIPRRARTKRDVKSEFITPEELKNGDIVVHIEHGIGRFEGLTTLEVDRVSQDFLLLIYQDDDRLYLPVDRIEMIGKYVGIDGYIPILDKIGSKSWSKSKAKAKEEVEKLAAELLDLYAERRVKNGFSFSTPDQYFSEFEASFPFNETPDQLKAIDDVLEDMESHTPMDRLVCGDVGYGKTEVAMRAAFRAVHDGQQVAIVVPTTLLAEQHFNTFKERFADYPVIIETLSRFRTRKEQNRIVKDLESGKVDIVIGTHRLLQKDVVFRSLGLLVIDEEQRFGVKHKEVLKKKRKTIDVLALTATPIPRTLHLSLTGMRDISVISTPPEDRQAIISYVSNYEDSIAADAIKKEIARNGQIFFVHNNIKTISKMADHLISIVPNARIGIAHGRLSENDLENVMIDFIDQKIDILVCTTIIESGLDIPSANTMIINKAERFGLAQIYQLRGRIGRGDCQAYAYLFISDESHLTKEAKKRLSALMEYKDLGSGFQIAMKDLQIRGAGTALGASQSGHIAAVGYDMFLKLLDQAVKDMRGEKIVEPLEPEINMAVSSHLPQDYIESVEQRLTIYRRLSRINKISAIKDFQKELQDRFGLLPKEAENMLLKIMLRVYCMNIGIKKMDLTPNMLTMQFSDIHMKNPMNLADRLDSLKITYSFIKKDTVRVSFEGKRNVFSRSFLETKQILNQLMN